MTPSVAFDDPATTAVMTGGSVRRGEVLRPGLECGLIPGSSHRNTETEDDARMAIRIKARQNESVGQMLRRFKKLCEKEGLTKDIKKRQYFEKPSERRRRAKRKAISRLQRILSGVPEAPIRKKKRRY